MGWIRVANYQELWEIAKDSWVLLVVDKNGSKTSEIWEPGNSYLAQCSSHDAKFFGNAICIRLPEPI